MKIQNGTGTSKKNAEGINIKQNIINARVTFRKSPIHVMEKFAFKDMPNAWLTFKKNSSVSECVIIQT